MSYSPPLLANRRWIPSGMSAADTLLGPSVASILTGGVAHRANNANTINPPIPAGTTPGDLMLLFVAGSTPNPAPTGWTYVSGTSASAGVGANTAIYSKTYVAGDTAPSVANAAAGVMTARIVTIPGRWAVQSGTATGSSSTSNSGNQYGLGIGAMAFVLLSTPAIQASVTPSSSAMTQVSLDNTDNTMWLGVTSRNLAQVNSTLNWPTASIWANAEVSIIASPPTNLFNQFAVPSWVELSPSAPFDTFTMDVVGDPFPTTGSPQGLAAKYLMDLAVGPAGSESVIVPLIEFSAPQLLSYGPGFWTPQLSIPVAIKAGQRVSARGYQPNNINFAPAMRFSFGGV